MRKKESAVYPLKVFGVELAKRTLTSLYNQRPGWLAEARARLDAAVVAAYGWPAGLGDEEVLALAVFPLRLDERVGEKRQQRPILLLYVR